MSIWTPRFHGNGFIQVYLDEDTRLHIWSPDFPATRVQNAQIHDHRFYFKSSVLLGKLLHTQYHVDEVPYGEHGLWQQGPGASCAKAGPLELIGNCNISEDKSVLYEKGSTYKYGLPGAFHESHGKGLTVTLMSKLSVAHGYRAKIISLNREKPDHAFENQPPLEDMQAEVMRVMGLLINE